jgi:Fur family transcriptional regulator, ferric uptake regulator
VSAVQHDDAGRIRTERSNEQRDAERRDVREIMERLAEAGGRRTASRQAIVEVIVEAGSHLTAEEIVHQVHTRFPSVNLSTVYRTLDALTDLGIVDHVHFGHGRAVYHRTDEAHQHLVCEACGAVEELPVARLRAFLGMIDRDFGFEVDRRHFAIVGRCGPCRRA